MHVTTPMHPKALCSAEFTGTPHICATQTLDLACINPTKVQLSVCIPAQGPGIINTVMVTRLTSQNKLVWGPAPGSPPATFHLWLKGKTPEWRCFRASPRVKVKGRIKDYILTGKGQEDQWHLHREYTPPRGHCAPCWCPTNSSLDFPGSDLERLGQEHHETF